MFFDSVYPTRPSDTETKYTIYLPILLAERLFKTQLKDAFYFTFLDRIFARVRF